MKKILITIGFLLAASAARASTYIPVLMSTATNPAVQAGSSTYSFHVASGTADNLNSSTFTATKATIGTGTITTGTVTNFTATSATMTTVNLTNANGTVADSGTWTHTGSHTFNGTATFTTVAGTITDNSTTTHTGGQTFNGQLNFAAWSYRRPTLQYNSATQVDVESNTATANQTQILFPDGSMFSVTENLATTSKYRRFKTGQNAIFTSGTPQGGLRSTLTATANTWYALYAVKCQMANETTNYVIVGDTFTPTQANAATLNSNFGTNGWVYLGWVRYGDNSGATTSIISFKQAGNHTKFVNTTSGGNAANLNGILSTTTASGTTITYTYAAGTGNANVPSNITLSTWAAASTSTGIVSLREGASSYIQRVTGNASAIALTGDLDQTQNVSASNGSAAALDLYLVGFIDGSLGVGPNPQF